MKVLARVVAAGAGAVTGFFLGQAAGCAFYEATGPRYAQCGYEFEGMGHAILGALVTAAVLAFVAQWIVGRALGFRRRGH